MADEFVAYPSRWRLALLVLAGAAFVATGLWMGGVFGSPPTSIRYSPEEIFIVGWVCVVFFALCTVIALVKLFEAGEQLRIDSNGIRYAWWSKAMIPWQEITSVTTWTFKRQRTIVLHLRDPAQYPGKGLAGRLAAANRKLTGGDICISLTGTDRGFDDAMSAIRRHRPL